MTRGTPFIERLPHQVRFVAVSDGSSLLVESLGALTGGSQSSLTSPPKKAPMFCRSDHFWQPLDRQIVMAIAIHEVAEGDNRKMPERMSHDSACQKIRISIG